jgi:hypothetical protein
MLADHDRFQHGEMREQADVLERARDTPDRALRGPRIVDWLAFEHDAPGIGGQHAGDEIEKRRLAGAVGTDQRMDVAAGHVHAHLVEGVEAAEPFGQAVD